MSSTGIRVGTIKELKIKHLKRLQENTNNIGILSTYQQSKNYRYKYGLLTPECMAALDEYFELRKRYSMKR